VSGVVVSVNIGKKVAVPWSGRMLATAIDKRPVAGPVLVGPLELAGDEHGNPELHGGLDQAVYAYAQEDAAYWVTELGREVGPGAFGENLTTAGVETSGAVSGERWRVGTALLQVTTPRMPCRVFAGFWDIPDLIRRFTQAGRHGTYLRVLTPGVITAGDQVELLDRPAHGVTVAELARARAGERSLMPRVRQIELPAKWRKWVDSVDRVKVLDGDCG
jgi:MOSC domain-containing protein YiiM